MAFAPTVALDYLRRAYGADRLGHAYLLVGGEPAQTLAWQLAALVVNASPNATAAHPDVHTVEPESRSRRILVEQMRALEGSLRLRASTAGGRKVGIIREADRLAVQASNAFLKTLEEPPASSLLLLVTAQPESLMETILSRCIKVVVQAPPGFTPARTVEESTLLTLLEDYRASEGQTGASAAPVAASYCLLREFMVLLGAVRNRLQGEADSALEREDDQYAKTTDGTWLAEREGYHKAMTEARYVAERARLVETLARWWGDRLRRSTASSPADMHPAQAPDFLRRLSSLDQLRENLDRNIQEALALEVAFLEVFR